MSDPPRLLLSDADHFRVEELNPYSHRFDQPDPAVARVEHRRLCEALLEAGFDVVRVPSPDSCQDGVYVANWALCRGGVAVASRLPNLRRGEEPHARAALRGLGMEVVEPPAGARFSGQGDALFCGDLLFCGAGYRSDEAMRPLLASVFSARVIGLEAVPELDALRRPVVNAITGWPDSLFYDLDLALAVLTPELIAWCPEAFSPASREAVLRAPVECLEVSIEEAVSAHACNLVSTGTRVLLSDGAPRLREAVERHGLSTVPLAMPEIAKGGGFIRCCSLTL